MELRFLRIAYALQFVITLMSTFEIWAQVGGQGHLDLVPWYWKLLLACALSLATVKATTAAVRRDKFWNRATFAWLVMGLALIVTMGVLTYYEHLHEPPDEGDEPPAQILFSDTLSINGHAKRAVQDGVANHWVQAKKVGGLSAFHALYAVE